MQTTKRILKGGGDILKEAVAAARDVGIEIHFYIRPEAFFAPFPYDGAFTSRFLTRNPRLRCRDENGNEVIRMSYAFPKVQDHMLDYFRELLDYDPDGLCFAFNRSLPMMICEKPVLDLFRKKHGRLPRLPEENESPELLAVRHEILADFVGRVHALLAERGKVFSCIAELDNDRNRLMGLDIGLLVERGYVESVCVGGSGSPFWEKLRDGRKTKVYSTIHYQHAEGTAAPDPFNHKCQAAACKRQLDAGYAGTWYWDADSMHMNPYNWHVLRHGGSREFLDRVLAGDPAVQPVFEKITEVRGVRRDRYDPMTSY